MVETLAEQALAAHRAGDTALMEKTLAHAFSVEAALPEDEPRRRGAAPPPPGPVGVQIQDGVRDGRENLGSGNSRRTLPRPGICSRRCCDPIRHLANPDAPAPVRGGSLTPRQGR